MVNFTDDYDYLTSMQRILIADASLKSKIDAFYIDFPMSKIRDALSTNETLITLSMPYHSGRGSWGSATSKIQENKAIVQIDIISQKGDNAKYCHTIAGYIRDLLYLGTDITLATNQYQIYNDHIDIDLVEYNTDYSAWHIIMSVYIEYWRVAP
jgi:hypothetical protein